MTRIRNSWELFKVSWGVLRSDKTLAAIPAISAVVSLVALAGFGGLFYALGIDTGSEKEGTEAIDAIGYVIAAVAYVVFAFITVYFQSALVAGANERLEGGDATVGKSLGAAGGKLHRILPWALVTATVSFIISQIERQGWIGQIVGNLLGMAWNVLTFLTIPIIMLEDVGPIAALKRSGTLFKKTWGENLVAQAGFGLFGFLLFLPAIAVGALGIATGNDVVAGVAIGIAVAWVAVVMVVLSALSGIYRTALYRYAVDGSVPPAFAGADLSGAFAPRRGGRFN
ncbi:MAG: hypothetical protein H0V95_09855 [Actinobacteria bacterium]|nr:hypothetical protein [Actinomycetota bacterium]